jgi:hypothetical protein
MSSEFASSKFTDTQPLASKRGRMHTWLTGIRSNLVPVAAMPKPIAGNRVDPKAPAREDDMNQPALNAPLQYRADCV